MPTKNKQPQIPLPKSWGTHVKSAILHVIALSQYALTYSRSWTADSSNERVRLIPGASALSWDASCIRPRQRASTWSATRGNNSGARASRIGAGGKGSVPGSGR